MRISLFSGKVTLLKNLDRILGRAAVCIVPPPPPTVADPDIRTILVIRPGGIGDAALLAPTIYSLQRKFPAAKINILAEKRNAGTFALIPGVARLLLYDSLSGLLQALHGSYDLVIDTEQWHRLSALIARLTGAPLLIGFDTNERRRMFSHAIPYRHDDYEASSFLHLLLPLGIECEFDETACFLFPPDDESERAAALVQPLAGAPFVSIFPGASIRERQWGSASFKQVVKMLEADGVRAIIVGGVGDRGQGDEIIRGSTALNLAGLTTLVGTAALIARSRALLSGDSGVLHLGVGLGVPTVSLFGPGIAAKWGPRGARHIILNTKLECSPCTRFGTTPPCLRNVDCLSGIAPETVATALLQLFMRGEK